MIRKLTLEGFRGAKSHVRCFAHILNLAVKVWHHIYLILRMYTFITDIDIGHSLAICEEVGQQCVFICPRCPQNKEK